jgi:hypothetical protein
MHLRMHQLDQAEKIISKAVRLNQEVPTILKFIEIKSEAYICAVVAQIEMAQGR